MIALQKKLPDNEYRIEWFTNSNPSDFTLGAGIYATRELAEQAAVHIKSQMQAAPRNSFRIVSFAKGSFRKRRHD